MARARNIKPAFFDNEDLGMADPIYSLLFIGLWTIADREGVLEDRPARIRAQIFPFRAEIDIEAALSWLNNHCFIMRYSVKGAKYIFIPKFVEHQNPHKNESKSGFPLPTLRKSNSRTVQNSSGNYQSASEKIGTTPADSLLLIPSSLNPEPPSLIPETLKTDRFCSTWEKWKRHRKEIGKPLKPSQEETQLARLATEGEQAAAERVEKSIANGWQGLWFGDEKKGLPTRVGNRREDAEEKLANEIRQATGGS